MSDEEEPPRKRFRYETYNQQLSHLKIDVGKSKGLNWDDVEQAAKEDDLAQTVTPLGTALVDLSLLYLTTPYQEFTKTIIPLSRSLPLILHYIPQLQSHFHDFFSKITNQSSKENSGLDGVMLLYEKFFETVIDEGVGCVEQATEDLLRIGGLNGLEAILIEKTYSTISQLFKLLSTPILSNPTPKSSSTKSKKSKKQPVRATQITAESRLRALWRSCVPYLSKTAKPHVRSCVAKVWAVLLRRARGEVLKSMVGVMVKGLEDEDSVEGLAAALSEGLKGAPHLLHSRAPQIYSHLVLHLLQTDTPQPLLRTLVLLTTCLIHHGSATALLPIHEYILKLLKLQVDESPMEGIDSLSETVIPTSLTVGQMEMVVRLSATLLGVRKGQRLPTLADGKTAALTSYLNAFNGIAKLIPSAMEGLQREYLKAVTAALVAGKVKDWLSPGIALIKTTWTGLRTSEKLGWVRLLVRVGWKGIEQFILADVARICTDALDSHRLETLSLLAMLADHGYLDGGLVNVEGGQWKVRLGRLAGDLFTEWADRSDDLNQDDIRGICKLLKVCNKLTKGTESFLPSLTVLLRKVRERLSQMSEEDAREEYNSAAYNRAYLLSCGLKTLGHLGDAGVSNMEAVIKESIGDASQLLNSWSWSRGIMSGIGGVASIAMAKKSPLETIMTSIASRLQSEDPEVRTGSLRILVTGKYPAFRNLDGEVADPEQNNVFGYGLEVEDAGMSLQNVRERTTKIRKIGLVLRSLEIPETEYGWLVEAIMRYLFSQLKVNFRPLYADTIEVLSELGKRYPELLWQIAMTEITKCHAGDLEAMISAAKPAWAVENARDHDRQESTSEKQRDFICPNANKLYLAADEELVEHVSTADNGEAIQDQVNDARLDMVNYEAQILELLGKLPSLTEKHGREIIPVFLNVSSADEEDDDEALLSGLKISRRLRQQRLSNYLTLFAHFGNPKALYRAEEVHASYLNILSKGENPLQNLALTCLFTYKHFFLNPYEDNLRGLLTESKFRDELTKFPLGRESEMINPDHRTELLPVVIRILFGIMISKKGRNSSNQGPTARKNAILAALGNCSGDDFVTLIELMLRSFPASVCQRIDLQTGESTELDEVRGRTQIGYLSMEADVLKHLSTQITQFWPTLLSTTLAVTANAQRHIVNEPAGAEPVPEDGEEAPDDEGDDEASALPARTIRNAGLRRLAAFFRAPASFDFSPYMPYLFEHIISPRLALLPQENTQAPSAIMDIFASWSQRPEMYPFLVKYDNRVLSQLFCCIAQPKVKPAVIAHVLDVVDRLLAAAEDEGLNGNIDNLFLAPYMSGLLDNLIICMDGINKVNLSRDDLVKRQISVLPRISPYTQPGEQARKLVALLVPILRKPTKQVSEKVKSDILTTLNAVLVKVPEFSDVQSDFYRQNYNVVSTLFRSLHTRPARQNLVQVLQSFVGADAALQPITDVIASLNAYSTKRMEEPDFDRRLQAFQTLHDLDHKSMSNRLWQPLLYNSLFFLQDPEELTIRSNAGEVIKHYIDTYKVKETCEDREYTITNLVLPGLRDILKSRVELVRAEAVVVIGHAVDKCVGMGVFDELRPLLADGDVEASFFSNVYHLQTHRRARAYRRLVEFVSSGKVRDATISGIFLPILGHVLSGATDKTDHSLVNEAITSIGKLAGKLGWSKYHAAVLSYLRLGTMKGSLQKYYVRAITALLDNFHFDMQQREIDNTEAEIDEGAENDGNEVSHVPVVSVQQSAKIADYVVGKLLPALVRFVQQKDETEDSIRIPVAVGIVKVAMVLPENIREEETGRVITVLSQILRSKDQDTRDLVKDTMCKIALTLGPDWLSRIIREMKASLQRGPQLHVLAVVTHAVLVHVTTEDADRFSSLDDAVADVVSISAEVVWGQSGQDVVAEGFKTKMREVRAASSRGYDSFQLVARLVSPNRVNSILVPLKNIMGETSAVKPMQQVDEALHRIASGLNSNPLLGPIELLRLCHTLISSSAEFLRPGKADNDQQAAIKDDYRVQMKRKILTNEDHYRVNSQKFVGFGLDLFVTAFRRGKFDFGKAEILGRISPLVNAIGNALYSSSDFVLILALKAAAAVTKTPLPAVDNAAPAMIVQIIKIIKRCGGSAVSEVAQVAIRSLAVIVRDCKSAVIKDKQLAYLVEIIGPDLDEHETQAPAFALLRAILSKRFVVPEVYDLMEKVASVMVTSQSTSVQELCRAAMLQFMLDYPQGKGRLKSTMQFLASNLSYVYESGRVSVMELLSHVFNKFSDELVMAYSSLFFLALVIVIANDDSEKCRSMAGELLKQLIGRYDENRLQELVNLLGKWAGQLTEDPALARSSAVVSALAVQSSKDGMRSHINFVIRYLNDILIASSAALERLETQEQVSVFDQVEFDYALPYQALNTMSTCLEEFPDQVDSIEWSAVTPLLIFPHDWVRLASARLLVSRLAKDQTSAKAMDLHDVARKSCLILASGADKGSSRHIPNEKLCGQVVRLLYSIGKQWIDTATSTDGVQTEAISDMNDEDAEHDQPEEVTENAPGQNGLSWLMSRLSFVARRLIINKPSTAELVANPMKWSSPLLAVFQVFAALVDHMSVDKAKSYLKHICQPAYRVLDESGELHGRPGDAEMENLTMLVTELRDMVSRKVGIGAFSRAWEEIRSHTAEKRTKRRVDAGERMISDPQAEASRRAKRASMKIDHRKRKVKAFADAKQRERPTRGSRK